MGDDDVQSVELFDMGVVCIVLKKMNGSWLTASGGGSENPLGSSSLFSSLSSIISSAPLMKGSSNPLSGRQSKSSGVSSSTPYKSLGNVSVGMSSAMQVSPAIGAKCVKSSGSSLSTATHRHTTNEGSNFVTSIGIKPKVEQPTSGTIHFIEY